MYKLSFSNPVFYTYDEGKITVCRFLCTVKSDGKEVFHYRVQGVAKCAAQDTLDPVLGKHIAESRAKKKGYAILRKYAYEHWVEYLDKTEDFYDIFSQMSYMEGKEVSHIANLIK